MKKRMNKKGLSDVVATVLIILLVLAAIGVIWVFVRGNLEGAGESIADGNVCIQNTVGPTNCVYTAVDHDDNPVTANEPRYVVAFEQRTTDVIQGLKDVTATFTYADGTVSSQDVDFGELANGGADSEFFNADGGARDVKFNVEYNLTSGGTHSCESIVVNCAAT